MSSIGSKASTDEQTSRSGRTCPWPCFADMTDMNSSDEVMRYVTDRNRNDMDVSIGTRFDRTGVIMPTPSVVCMNTLPSTLTICKRRSGCQLLPCCLCPPNKSSGQPGKVTTRQSALAFLVYLQQ